MEGQGDSAMPRFDSKLIGERRSSSEMGDNQEVARKRIKMRDLESVWRSEGINPNHSKVKEASGQIQLGEDMSQVTDVPVTLDVDASEAERKGRATISAKGIPASGPLDLNCKAFIVNDSGSNDIPKGAKNYNKLLFLKKHDGERDNKCLTSGGIGLDLNAEDVTSSVNHDPVYLPFKDHQHLKSRDVSECGSTTGPLQEKDPLSVWLEMKQNGFLSTSHGGFSIQSGFMSSSYGGIPMPKHRGRKSKNDVIKKKIELAKREQVDRFTKIAAPSGLLNELNPGIINHVRNKKQVHSIIEALVRSEKLENDCLESKQASHPKSGTKETSDFNELGINHLCFSHGSGSSTALFGGKQTGDTISTGEGDVSMVDKIGGRNFVSHSYTVGKDDTLALKLSSSAKAAEHPRTFSNQESANVASVSCLSVRAATVASQWLELIHQDIKGRLTALRRSRKRVRAVITTELPFLISKEFSCNQDIDPCSEGLSNNATATMHQARWSTMFDQMDKRLSEEEQLLESWLNQLKEMQHHCDQGLQHFHWNAIFGFQQQGSSEICTRTGKADGSANELAVRAAAASIYSTCNFLMSMENLANKSTAVSPYRSWRRNTKFDLLKLVGM